MAATKMLQTLLDNWERAVIDCTYADVPRELLEQKNKELLLEKPSTYALFDKSVSVVSCKTYVSTVRDYLGRTGIGPVAGLDKTLQALLTHTIDTATSSSVSATAGRGDDDTVEMVAQAIEDIQRDLMKADSLSYAARRDYSSINNFDPEESVKVLDDTTSNLRQCKAAIQSAIATLNKLLATMSSVSSRY
jgi:hypothetical protein